VDRCLFALTLQKVVLQLEPGPEFMYSYPDDGLLCGSAQALNRDFEILKENTP